MARPGCNGPPSAGQIPNSVPSGAPMPMLCDPSMGSIATDTSPSAAPAMTPSASSETIWRAPAATSRRTKKSWLATSSAFCRSPPLLTPTMRFGSPGTSPRASRRATGAAASATAATTAATARRIGSPAAHAASLSPTASPVGAPSPGSSSPVMPPPARARGCRSPARSAGPSP